MKYSFKNLLKMFFTGKPDPYSNKEVSKSYKTYVINFPDGITTTDKYFANIPDYTTWSEPMVELFLLIVKDWRNLEKLSEKRDKYQEVRDLTVTHKPTGISFKGIRYVEELASADGCITNRAAEHYWYSLLLDKELYEVTSLAKIWKEVHYGNKLARIGRIYNIRKDRIRQEQEIKRAELAKQARSAEANRIREYLEGINK